MGGLGMHGGVQGGMGNQQMQPHIMSGVGGGSGNVMGVGNAGVVGGQQGLVGGQGMGGQQQVMGMAGQGMGLGGIQQHGLQYAYQRWDIV